MMPSISSWRSYALLPLLIIIPQSIFATEVNKYLQDEFICRLLRYNYIESQPWAEYPIIYQPIKRGRLTIWSGTSTLPGSEYICSPSSTNDTIKVTLNYPSFADKLEWTFFDATRGITHDGITVNLRENVNIDITIDSKQLHSYIGCNTVEEIELKQGDGQLMTMCRECGGSNIAHVNNLISELVKTRLNDEIVENLRWHLTQSIATQRFSGPIPL